MVSINGDTPTSMVFVREHPFKVDDLGVPPILGNPHLSPVSPCKGISQLDMFHTAHGYSSHFDPYGI